MRKMIIIMTSAIMLPISSFAIEQVPPPPLLLDDSASFQIAETFKLGQDDNGLALKPKKAMLKDDTIEEFCNRNKGLYYNPVTKKCEQINSCDPNPCNGSTPVCETVDFSVDPKGYKCLCSDTSCGEGKTCVGGQCINCQKGVNCNCPSGEVSDGNGSCYTPANKCVPHNPCPSSLPNCSPIGETDYSCSCTSNPRSCPDGTRCSDNNMACKNCPAGDRSDDCGCSQYGKEADGNGGCRCPGMKISDGYGGCKCPTDYESDGTWGGCKLIDPCMNVDCPDAKRCEDGECVNCSAGSDCGCYDDDATANGDGVCEPNIHECDPGKEYNTDTRSCENCAENADCGCFDQGGYADGNGGCRIVCEDWEYWDGSKCVPAVGACETSADCVSGNYCLDHSCRPGCESDDDCGDGSYCENNACVSGCKTNDNCDSSEHCINGVCKNACDAQTSNPCTDPRYPKCQAYNASFNYTCMCTSTSCPAGYECRGSYTDGVNNTPDSKLCKTPLGDGDSCSSNAECLSYKHCFSGVCKDACEAHDTNPCTDPRYPTCQAYNASFNYTCICNSSSCPSGYECKGSYTDGTNNTPDSGMCKPASCTSDSDCEYSESCVGGICKTACDDNPCTNPKYPTCTTSGKGYICKCTSSSCGSGYKCETTSSGVSYDKNSPDSRLCKVLQTETCTTDENCSAEKKCRNGYCIFRDTCSKDSDCTSTERCSENGYCVLK